MITETTDTTVRSSASKERVSSPAPKVDRRLVERYYSETLEDYAAWSPNFHMHFGFFRRGMNPFAREKMLAEMTRQVASRLDLNECKTAHILDMGCGLGASSRLVARERPLWNVDGVTIVRQQVERAEDLNATSFLEDRVRTLEADYTALPFPDQVYDGAFAIESACHAPGLAKEDFVREAARVLKPGTRLVVADGFLKREGPMPPILRRAFDLVYTHWALPTFGNLQAFTSALQRHGFGALTVEEISWRIAPSVLHSPWVTFRFLLTEAFRTGKPMTRERWGHLLACLLAPVIGAARHRFGYYLVSARKLDQK